MEIDKEYKMKLLSPLKGMAGIKITDYLSSLESNGILVEDDNGVVDEKFIAHFKYLIQNGLIENSSGNSSLDSFGLGIGLNGHITHWNCSDLVAIEPITPQPQVSNTINIGGSFRGNLQSGMTNEISGAQQKSIAQWFIDHIVSVIIAGLAVAAIVAWLGIKP